MLRLFLVITGVTCVVIVNPAHGQLAGQTRTYDMAAYDAYQAYAAGNLRRAAGFQLEAARLKRNDSNFYFDAALWYAIAGAPDSAILALEGGIAAGLSDVRKITTNPELRILQEHPRWSILVSRLKQQNDSYASMLKAPTLRDELLAMWANDQRARTEWVKKHRELKVAWNSPVLTPEYNEIYEIDARNTRRIKEIITKNGWPTIPLVGRDGAYAAWSLVQHSDDVPFQDYSLALMWKALSRHEVDPEEYAELYDRIRRNKYEKQRFGMATCDAPSGNSEFCSIEDEGLLDERRKALGLEPSTVTARLEGFLYQPMSRAEAMRRDAVNRARAKELIELSQRAFLGRRYEESRTLFGKALRYFGDVETSEIVRAALQFAPSTEQQEQNQDFAFKLLKILKNRGQLGRKLLREPAFDGLRVDKRWKELTS